MCHCTGRKMNSKQTVKLISALVCVLFFMTFLFSTAFIMLHLNHEHDHNGEDGSCATCTHILICVKLIENLGRVITAAAAIVCITGIAIMQCFAAPQINALNLITLKVRLNI